MSEIRKPYDLNGKVAIVTGGGSGLGREFCDVLAEFGADVICPDLFLERAEETCKIIKKYGRKAVPISLDVARYEQVQQLFKQVMTEFGKVDILVNNAGVAPPSVLIDETDLNDWHRVIDVDLHGVFYCMKEALGIMKKQKGGVIINISSTLGISAHQPSILAQSPYVAAKHGVVGLTRQAAAEYGPYGIRVNCIAPGFHRGTRLPDSLHTQITDDEERKKRGDLIIEGTPLRRIAEPKELRGILLLLASDNSSFMTGSVVVSDGGMTIC